jgi:hypothetical protein
MKIKNAKNTFIALRCFLFIMSRGVLVKTRHFQLTSLCFFFKWHTRFVLYVNVFPHTEQTNRFPSCLLLKWRFKSLSYPKTLPQSLHLNSLIPCAAFWWATRDCLWQYLLSQSVHVYCFSWKKSWKSVFNRYIYIQFLNLDFHQLIKLFLNCKRNKKYKVPKGSIKLNKSQ